MTPNQLSSKVDGIISKTESLFGKQVTKTNTALFEQMQLLLNKLEVSSSGVILQNQANRAILSRVDEYFTRALNESGYYVSLDSFGKSVIDITASNSAYFSLITETFTPDAQYIKSLQRQTIGELETLLANEGLELALKEPIVSILNQNINTGAALTDLTKQLREFILGSDKLEPTLARYSKQIANDSLFNFNRALQESISQKSGLEWYLYSGSVMDTTRDFCASKAGKYFKRSDIEKWPSQSWTGKRKGTTKSTIYVYLGGHFCRHSLVPVSESIVPKSYLK